MAFYLYILKCSDDSYYVGHTDNIETRINEHALGLTKCYTQNKRPFTIALVQEFVTRYEALCAELKVKKWSRAKKEAFIKGDWSLISALSKRKNKFPGKD